MNLVAKPYRARRWRPAMPDPVGCWLLSRTLHISPVTAQVLYNRGFTTPEAAHAFLTAGREQMLDPFMLKDMDRAVALIQARIRSGRPIMIYGDYDVDGVTGTTILVLALRALGATVDYYIPNRFSEGYGLNVGALKELRERGHDFILSVDTGTTAVPEAVAAQEMGMTLVVSDHHEPGPVLPDVAALINPKRPDDTYPFKGLAGVGVAFKLALALGAPNAWDLLDIVTLGTIADMVPLVGENRAIVREGLAALGSTRRPGLRALMEVAGVKTPVTATHIGYALGPRINALGRMGSAMEGVELLVTEDPVRGAELARHLDEENKNRQEIEAAILAEALEQAEKQPASEKEYVLVLAGEGWHHGVVGICASRVLEAYHRPTILLSIDGDEVRGSARSIPGFHMQRALLQVSDLFTKFGGHAAAAGMTLKRREDLPVLRQRLNEIGARWLRPEDLVPELRIDASIGLNQVNDALMAELQSLEPHGIGNPAPIFAVKDAIVTDVRTMGKESNHLKLFVKDGRGAGVPMEAVGWGMAPAKPSPSARVQVAFHPEYDTYMGRNRLRLGLKDVQVIDGPDDNGMPVNVGAVPQVPVEACLQWDPLAGIEEAQASGGASTPAPRLAGGAPVIDARDKRLTTVLTALTTPDAEVAAAAESADDEAEEPPEPTRLLYLEALVAAAEGPVLVRTASPWAAAALVADLQAALPEQRTQISLWLPGQPEPQGCTILVAPYGLTPKNDYAETVLYHPPYHPGQLAGGRLHLLWEKDDWELAAATLGWAYPDREALIPVYQLLRRGGADADELARQRGQAPGPWAELQLQAGVTIFREMGLVDPAGHLTSGRFDLASSTHYRRGQFGQQTFLRLRTDDWPDSI